MDSCSAENCWLFARGVDLDLTQRVAASDLGGHCSLYPSMKIKLDGHFAEKCWFPADGVCPDWTRQDAAFDLGMHWLVCPCVEIDVQLF